MSLLDSLHGFQTAIVNGVELVTRRTIQFTGWVTGADNATAARTELEMKPPIVTEPPTTGTYAVGDVVFNANATVSGYVGWVCITAGTPGSWAPYGLIVSP